MKTRWNDGFVYEVRQSGVRILRCFCFGGFAGIPHTIEGMAVTELAPYAFSCHMDGALRGVLEQTTGDRPEGLQELCGPLLREISLPAGLHKIGKYAFYNCSRLERIQFHNGIRDIGAGAFTGCHRVNALDITMHSPDAFCLKEILMELSETLYVRYRGKEGEACLWFPEFYEEGVENTPARILETHVHGSGLHYRNCFVDRQFCFQEYDSLFYLAKAQEEASLAAEIALGRLLHPYAMLPEARKAYETYLGEHAADVGAYLIRKKEGEKLAYAAEHCLPRGEAGASVLSQWIAEAGRLGYAQGSSYLMDYKHKKYPGKRKKYVLI